MDGELFNRLCEEHGTNITKIATKCGLNRLTIQRWLKGAATPGLRAAYDVADLLETTVQELWPRPTKRSPR
jgi:DNA-binding XRE family transcriptional regulator